MPTSPPPCLPATHTKPEWHSLKFSLPALGTSHAPPGLSPMHSKDKGRERVKEKGSGRLVLSPYKRKMQAFWDQNNVILCVHPPGWIVQLLVSSGTLAKSPLWLGYRPQPLTAREKNPRVGDILVKRLFQTNIWSNSSSTVWPLLYLSWWSVMHRKLSFSSLLLHIT